MKECNNCSDGLLNEMTKVMEQNARYKAALEQYADENSWEDKNVFAPEFLEINGYQIAKDALEVK